MSEEQAKYSRTKSLNDAASFSAINRKLIEKKIALIKRKQPTEAIQEVIDALFEAEIAKVNHAAEITSYIQEFQRLKYRIYILESRIIDLVNELKTSEL